MTKQTTIKAFEKLAELITAKMDNPTWKPSWNRLYERPFNVWSKHTYTGVNAFILAFHGFFTGKTTAYMTFQQVKKYNEKHDTKLRVTKGNSIAISVFVPGKITIDDEGNEELDRPPFFRTASVWSVDDIEGFDMTTLVTPRHEFTPIENIETAINKIVPITNKGARAFYTPVTDCITMPEPDLFNTSGDYYYVLTHELIHATGHQSRLDRLDKYEYDQEEMVAEVGAFLFAINNNLPVDYENSASYIASWGKDKIEFLPEALKLANDAVKLISA